jgi:hypothetical protein
MRVDEQGNVLDMSREEFALFRLYQECSDRPDGQKRDFVPYTPLFDQLHQQFKRETNRNDSPREFWLFLRYVLKHGVDRIERFFRPRADARRRLRESVLRLLKGTAGAEAATAPGAAPARWPGGPEAADGFR